mmetsp:Transcript_74877/g.124863  ORF Transcript_74877/g.124863 Transcript_74877/m.124863 type:complete len:87 (+) Transcript_74877:253-513(+)
MGKRNSIPPSTRSQENLSPLADVTAIKMWHSRFPQQRHFFHDALHVREVYAHKAAPEWLREASLDILGPHAVDLVHKWVSSDPWRW